jgi:ComF family protein
LGTEARRLVHELKYGEARSLAEVAADTIVRRVAVPHADVVVPIPTGPRRLKRRGYNQAGLIAEALGARWSLPVVRSLLARRDATSQTGLSPMLRAANVRSAFEAGRALHRGRMILVDDVLTTGATIDAATRVLADAGWQHMVGVTFARTPSADVKLMWSREW